MPSILQNRSDSESLSSTSNTNSISSGASSSLDASFWPITSHSYHGLPFQISYLKDSHKMSVTVPGLTSYSLVEESNVFGKKYTFYDEVHQPMYRIKDHRMLGYIDVSSTKFATHIRVVYPTSSHKTCNFHVGGVKYSWEFDGQHFKCYNTTDMIIVAQIYLENFENSLSKQPNAIAPINHHHTIAQLAIVPQAYFAESNQTLIIVTGLIILKHLIWN
ncbi:hypothetical protein K493DRAFT_338911 [Basidiobolus meristosporus CBS 931.73]|uniref:Uncharacterized protein n=1 Tax=Basidiobolus meristosporus CBS 931.73 TaxID=1314790 RepID=A0A1Y1Y3M1_9FUNG|nr:hypothetical protein K493DRAFT_338911 [Basidiobolus meristosporus CBS 931.73]|eukprot:ORX92194.1 hypothetical protein K493DRAFT_338911 [Basidiobolus meristosporus CBS 931.73]